MRGVADFHIRVPRAGLVGTLRIHLSRLDGGLRNLHGRWHFFVRVRAKMIVAFVNFVILGRWSIFLHTIFPWCWFFYFNFVSFCRVQISSVRRFVSSVWSRDVHFRSMLINFCDSDYPFECKLWFEKFQMIFVYKYFCSKKRTKRREECIFLVGDWSRFISHSALML